MTDTAAIDNAIGAHGMWKARLKTAIATGTMETPVATIRMDDQCAFGNWLHGSALSSADKASAHFQRVKGLHAEFHKIAAGVAELALAGRKAEAEKMVAPDGEFGAASVNLTLAMMAWKNSLG